MKKITGGEAIIDSVVANGVDTIFGIPGAQIYPLFDGIYKQNLNLVVPRHEQSAAYMAMGYAKSSGKTGTFAVVPGPGILNTAAALCTAMGNCSPVVGLTGQVPTSFVGKGRGHLHELKDQRGTLKSIIKDAFFIEDAPAQTSQVVNRAFETAREGRPGPVTVEMCWDTMAAVDEFVTQAPTLTRQRGQELDVDALRSAAAMMARARKPMIMCGSGALHAAESVGELASLLNAPVSGFRSGRGVVSEDHPLGVPPVAARQLWDECDLLIGIGSRLEMPYMRWGNYMEYKQKPSAGPKLIRIDIDPDQMKIFEPDLGLVGDSDEVCRVLCDLLQGKVNPDPARLDQIAGAKAMAWRAIQRVQPQLSYLSVIRETLPRDGIYVPELSQMGFATWVGGLPVYAPRTYIDSGFQGTLGFGFPTALGAKVANPHRAVVSVCGDGGFMFAAQELMTAVEFKIGLVTIVVNNNSYGNVRRDQELGYGARYCGSELKTPDFVKLAESFGAAGYRVATPEQLKPVLERCFALDEPCLIEIVCERGAESSAWEFIHPRAAL
ncbi:Acetolactate synthase large subunit [Marinobacterium lacunae]|uniref:Acetolactate synthase large subunit n=1 Tax=Marinobacterium lacunae TaxID=1232683 RepID=A0A081FZV5_9GAMM|nr:thiamine pyrophosphate-dependent enzyme [Marinobacterium lacunae]KEA64060.1 Acetolactate synthase large subunit [Marinobacterium lacunae]